jgi:hypothetical protein
MNFVNMVFQLLKRVPFSLYIFAFCAIVMIGQLLTIKSVVADNEGLRHKVELDSLNAEAREAVVRKVADSYLKSAVQEKLRADSLDKKLKLQPKAKMQVEVKLPPVLGDAKVVGSKTDSVSHTYEYGVIDKFLSGNITARVFADTTTPRVSYDLRFNPFLIDVRLGCSGRYASVAVTPPKEITMGIANVEQDPSICNARLVETKKKSHAKLWFGLGLVGGAFIAYHVK